MSHQPSPDFHGEDQAPTATHIEAPKPHELYEPPNAQSLHRQSLGINTETPDLAALPVVVQRTAPTMVEKTAAVRSIKGKEKEWAPATELKKPKQLLDLPVDILKEIIEKVCLILGLPYGIADRSSYRIPTTSPHSRFVTLSSMP